MRYFNHRMYIRNAYIPLKRSYICNANINELGETVVTSNNSGLRHTLSHISQKEVQDA